jgi:hypothetical protein
MFSFSDGRETLLVMPEIPTDEAIAAVRSQLAGSSDVVREGVEWVIVSAGDRVGDGTREGVEWAVTTADRLGVEGVQLGDITHEGMRWATDFVGSATEYAADAAGSGANQAANFWCNRFGNCEPEATAAAE